MIIEEEIPAALAGERLDRIVALLTGASRSDAAQLVANGGATIDGEVVVSGKIRLAEGQQVTIRPDLLPRIELPVADPSVQVAVVYEDDDIAVVDKHAGLVVHPGHGHPDGTLVNGLLARFPNIAEVGDPMRPGIVHRLDVGTSGLLMVATSQLAYEVIVAALAQRLISRGYLALVWGHPAAANGLIDAPIGRDHREPMKMAVVVDGKIARTKYSTLTCYDRPVDAALLSCHLETGRTHQIRVHLAATGHPVVGDATYGGVRSGLSSPRPFLHAAELRFDHPRTQRSMHFESTLPDDLAAVLATMVPVSD